MRRLLLALALAFVVLGADRSPATADSSPNNPQQRLQVIQQIRAQLGSNLADAVAAQQQLRQSLVENAAQQEDLQAKIADLEGQISDLDTQIAVAQQREAALTERIATERVQIRQLARGVYESPSSVLLVLAQAHSLSDLFTRVADLSVAGSRAADLKSSLAADLALLEQEQQAEQAARDQQAEQRDDLASQLAKLKALQAQQQKSMRQLEIKIAQTRSELALLTRQSTALAQAVTDMLQQQQDAIIAAAMQSVWTQLQLWLESNNVGQIQTSEGHSTKYRFIWPEPNAKISQGFGPTTFWFEPPYGSYAHFHTGIDMVEPFGSAIYAADDGVVALVGSTTSGYGKYVVIAHSGGFDTLYGHLSTTLVKVGQRVTQGTPVGLEGSTGNSTGPHLHFELRIGQKPVDPTPYLPPGGPSAFRG
ncbi:MAG TPA: peptidoglycan DD-metalloendopeptidase family protein [Candidatus Dormibacteraeota bacterium]